MSDIRRLSMGRRAGSGGCVFFRKIKNFLCIIMWLVVEIGIGGGCFFSRKVLARDGRRRENPHRFMCVALINGVTHE